MISSHCRLMRAGVLLILVFGCRGEDASAPELTRPQRGPQASTAAQAPRHAEPARGKSSSAHPSSAASPTDLAPPGAALRANWLERIADGDNEVVIAPPVGATARRSIVVGVHGAGDRPDWSCGGWRLACQASLFVVCPQGQRLGSQTFAWTSSSAIEQRVETALRAARERFGPYIASGPLIYAGFSQGATLAENLLRKQAARFPIAILAEGGYGTSRSPDFARAYKAAGGKRVVLVCGSPGCFASSVGAKRVLQSAGLEVLITGDERAGHNLNDRMQKALQFAWPSIAAPGPLPAAVSEP